MSSWQQDINEKLQDLNECCVRADINQGLSSTEKQTARTNIGFTPSSVSNISGDDYKVVVNY